MTVNFTDLLINEFKEDLEKQCLVLMGIPAAGKSTFINNDLPKYFPAFSSYKVMNSDNKVKQLQFYIAGKQYKGLTENVESEADIKQFKADTKYLGNDDKEVVIPISYNGGMAYGNKGLKYYWKTFYKTFYATYFDIRDEAKVLDKKLGKTKVVKSGNLLIIDTVAAKHKDVLERLTDAKYENFNNTIIYLEIDPNLCIERDIFRHKTEGRMVGEDVIIKYAKNMGTAYNVYEGEGSSPNGVVDRLLRFVGIPAGNSPIKGKGKLIKDNRYELKRKLFRIKQGKE